MDPQTKSQLLQLPPELRNDIYDLVFEGCSFEVDLVNYDRAPESVGLLLACKRTYTEAIIIFYHNVVIQGRSVLALLHWARYLPSEHLNLVPEVRLIERIHGVPLGCDVVPFSEKRLNDFAAVLSKHRGFHRARLAVDLRTLKEVEKCWRDVSVLEESERQLIVLSQPPADVRA